jgi:hypothetical protein
VRVNGNTVNPSQYNAIGQLNSIKKTPEHFQSLYYTQRKNTAKAFAGTSTVAPLEGIESAIDIDIDVDNLINDVDPIGAAFDPRTPNTEVPTSITSIQIEVPGIRAYEIW